VTNTRILTWALISVGLMIVGAFGPWATVLGASVSGTDGHNDGWIVIVIALLGGLFVYGRRESRDAGIWALLIGGIGVAATLYDRHNLSSAISQAGAFGAVIAHIGWGLNLSLFASVSLAASGLGSYARSSSSPAAVATQALPARALAIGPARASLAYSPAAAPSAPVPATVPAGWYKDPQDPSALRYWSGSGWTTQTAKPTA
jgi:hypothetical protein